MDCRATIKKDFRNGELLTPPLKTKIRKRSKIDFKCTLTKVIFCLLNCHFICYLIGSINCVRCSPSGICSQVPQVIRR